MYMFYYRKEQIQKLGMVIGNENTADPDKSYQLTTDNAKKILAIYMRFRYVMFKPRQFIHFIGHLLISSNDSTNL